MPVYLSQGSTRPYFKETRALMVSSREVRDHHVQLIPESGKVVSFPNVKSVSIGTPPVRHVSEGGHGEGTVGSTTLYVFRRGTYCEIVRGGDGAEYLQCQRGKWKMTPGPRPKAIR
jgi:hypothetical protein